MHKQWDWIQTFGVELRFVSRDRGLMFVQTLSLLSSEHADGGFSKRWNRMHKRVLLTMHRQLTLKIGSCRKIKGNRVHSLHEEGGNGKVHND